MRVLSPSLLLGLLVSLAPPARAQDEPAEEPAAQEAAPAEEPAAAGAEEPAPGEAAKDSAGADAEAKPAKKASPRKAAKKGAERKAPNLFLETPSGYWVIDFEPKHLRMISPKSGMGAGRVYMYLLYTLTNGTKEDREIFVDITASSENGKQFSDIFLPSVEKEVERKEGSSDLWGKSDLVILQAKKKPDDPKYNYVTLKAGERRSCVAIFNRLHPNAQKLKIQVAGLSNEIRGVTKEDGSRELEERIRELSFERTGDEYAITLDTFTLTGKEWTKKKVPISAAPAAK